MPSAHPAFLAWVSLGAVAQLAATAFLIGAMEQRSFVVAVAYSKTEIMQIGVYSILLLAEPVTVAAACAIALASAGVVLLSVKPLAERGAGFRRGSRRRRCWASRPGPVSRCRPSGTGRRRSRSITRCRGSPGSLRWSSPRRSRPSCSEATWPSSIRPGLAEVLAQWRVSLLAGFTGALASTGWFTAFAMRSAVDVRIVGLVEVIYSYFLSRRFFVEPVARREIWGIVLVVAGIVVISTMR